MDRTARKGPFVRSPLRYPGGKSRAVAVIKEHFPKNLKTLCSPFLGGASVELACAREGIKVYAADAFEPLVNFWQKVKEDPALLAEKVQKHFPLDRKEFYYLQKIFQNLEDFWEKAAIFFILNRASFSGTTLSGGMSPDHPRFTRSSIERLRLFCTEHLEVAHSDWKETLSLHPNTFLYLDPPYANEGKLYGNKGNLHADFDHEALAQTLKKRKGWVLSYNECQKVRDLYAGCKILTPKWTYGMSGKKASHEVLIIHE